MDKNRRPENPMTAWFIRAEEGSRDPRKSVLKYLCDLFYEWAGEDGNVRIQIPKGATTAKVANLLEQSEGSPLEIENGNSITVPTHPFEIVTVHVEYPAPTP
jgi:hypothetical protein